MKRANDKITIGLALMFLLIVSSFLFPGSPAYAVGDIFCNYNKKRYNTPNQCVPECKVRMKNPMGGCFLSPQCGRLPNDKTLKQLYDQAVFLRGPVRRPSSYIALVKHIIDRVIQSPDVKSDELNIQVGKFGCQFYMQIVNEPTIKGGQKQYPFLINEKSFFELSPAYLILAITHEIQHLCQIKRGIGPPEFSGYEYEIERLRKLVHAFGELEVSYYDIKSDLFECLTEKEKEEVKWKRDYYEWKVKEAIEGVTGSRRLLNQAEKWLNSYIWTRGNWLPENPKWKEYKADWGNKPPDPIECPGK